MAVACLFVLLHLRPSLLFADTTPTGGDLGGHVWGPSFLHAHLWGAGGVLGGWSKDWFGGFPAYRFYMPVPAFGAVLLDRLVAAGVALKLMVALPLIPVPAVAARFGRSTGLGAPGPAMLAGASLVYLFDVSHHMFGGNILSTVTGEYGNGGALVIGLLCLAVYNADLARARAGPLAGVLGGLASLFHPVGAMVVLAGTAVRTIVAPRGGRVAAAVHLARTLGLTGLLAAFWYLPGWWHRAYFNDLGFPPRTNFGKLLFPFWIPFEVVLGGLLVAGVADAVLRRRSAILGLAGTAAVFVCGVILMPRGVLWNARLVPPWQLCRLLVAGAGAAALLAWGADRVPASRRRFALGTAAATTMGLLLMGLAWDTAALPGGRRQHVTVEKERLLVGFRWGLGPSHMPSLIPDAVTSAFGGYERNAFWDEHRELIDTLKSVAKEYGCGRVMPEFDASGHLGSLYALNLLPTRTDGCLTTVTGRNYDESPTVPVALVAESALSKIYSNYKPGLPYEPLNLRRGVAYLYEFGARYYLAHSPEAVEQARQIVDLYEVATSGPWTVFFLKDSLLVQPLPVSPVVLTGLPKGRAGWERVGLDWFAQARPDAPRVTLSGPKAWPRYGKDASLPKLDPAPAVEVSDVEEGAGKVRFRVTRPGVPVLVRESYFPTWRARGARGPWRVAPNWMVVMPTAREVELTYQAGTVAWLGVGLSGLGMAAALAMAIRPRWKSLRRRRRADRIGTPSG